MKNFLSKFKWFITGGVVVASLTAYIAVAAPFTVQQGGIGQSNVPNGSLLYGSSTNQSLNVLPVGASGTVLTILNNVPGWAPVSGGGGGSTSTQPYYTVCSSGCDYTTTGTNDQTVINTALTAHSNIALTAQIYNISGTILMHTNNSLRGAGIDTTILKLTNSANTDVIGTNATSSNVYFASISNLRIDGNSANNSSGTGINMALAHTWAVDFVHVVDTAGIGIWINGTSTATALNNWIQNNRVENTGHEGIDIGSYSPNNHIINNIVGGTVAFDGISVQNDENQIALNHVHTAAQYGIGVFGSNNIIDTNYIESSAKDGVYIEYYGIGNRLVGNVAFNNGSDGGTRAGFNIAGVQTSITGNRAFDRQTPKQQDYAMIIADTATGTIATANNFLASDESAGDISWSATAQANNSVMSSTGGFVGIGTANPTYPFQVSSGNVLFQPDINWSSGDTETVFNGDTNTFWQNTFGSNSIIQGGGLQLQTVFSTPVIISPNGATSTYFFTGGDLGINGLRYTFPTATGTVGQVLGITATSSSATTLAWTTGGSLPYGGQSGLFLGNTASGTPAWLTPGYISVCKTGGGCNYTATSTTATVGDDQIAIQAAMDLGHANYVAGAGPTTIYIKGYGTTTPYVLSNRLEAPSGITVIGDGPGRTVIKAKTNFSPTLNSASGISLVVNSGQSASNTSGPVSNLTVEGITFDANGQNIASASTTQTSINRTIYLKNGTNIRFIDNEIINCLSWCTDFDQNDQLWIERNNVRTGWSNTLNQQDGIHVSDSKNFHILNNHVTTSDGGTSGDDCFAVQQFSPGFPIQNGEVAGNTANGCGSRGYIAVINNDDIVNLDFHDNRASSTVNSGFKIYASSGTTGVYRNLQIHHNQLYNVATQAGTTENSDGIRLENDTAGARTMYINSDVNNNEINGVVWASGWGINGLGAGSGLKAYDNNITGVTGNQTIRMDNTSSYSFVNGVNYGFGTSTAGSALTVQGNIYATGNITCGGSCGGTGGSGNAAWTIGNGLIYNATSTDLVGIGTITPTTTLYVQGKGGTNPFIIASSTGNTLVSVTQAGNLGIGTASPGFGLDIALNTTSGLRVLNANGSGSSGGGGLQAQTSTTSVDSRLGFLLFGSSGTNSTEISSFSDSQWTLGSSQPGYLVFKTTPNNSTSRIERVRITSSGLFGIGSTTPVATLSVQGTTTVDTLAIASSSGTSQLIVKSSGRVGIASSTPNYGFVNNGTAAMTGLTTSGAAQTGDVCINSVGELINDSALCITSARRYKDSINPLGSALAEVLQLQPVSFMYKPEFNGPLQSNPNYNGEQVGFIADDVQKIDPRLTTVVTDGADKGLPESVRYANMTALLTKAIQEQQAQIEQLKQNNGHGPNLSWLGLLGLLAFIPLLKKK